MQCLSCGLKNPATVSYCQRCGMKMDLTADEIKASLVDKAKDESAKNTEYYARQSLTFGIILLLIMFTMLVLAGGAPGEAYYIPSASNGAEYVGIEYRVQIELPDLVFPIEGLK